MRSGFDSRIEKGINPEKVRVRPPHSGNTYRRFKVIEAEAIATMLERPPQTTSIFLRHFTIRY